MCYYPSTGAQHGNTDETQKRNSHIEGIALGKASMDGELNVKTC